MKLYGQLERAQFENLSSNPSAATAGRIWYNTTDGKSYLDSGSLNRAFLVNDANAIIGNSGTAADNIRFHRGAAGVLQLVTGSDATSEGSLSGNLNKLSFKFETYLAAGKPTNGNAGRVIYVSDLTSFFFDDGTTWKALGSGGGGGGGANWQVAQLGGPAENYEYDEKVWLFTTGEAQKLILWCKVPSSYNAGTQIKMNIGLYSPSAADTFKFQTVATLVQKNSTAVDSTTNQATDVGPGDFTNTVAKQFRTGQFLLTNSTGQINSVAVAAGDLIKVELSRVTPSGTDDTADLRMVPSATEVLFA